MERLKGDEFECESWEEYAEYSLLNDDIKPANQDTEGQEN